MLFQLFFTISLLSQNLYFASSSTPFCSSLCCIFCFSLPWKSTYWNKSWSYYYLPSYIWTVTPLCFNFLNKTCDIKFESPMYNLAEYVIALSENFKAKEVGVHSLLPNYAWSYKNNLKNVMLWFYNCIKMMTPRHLFAGQQEDTKSAK